jgi:hypothetical protein
VSPEKSIRFYSDVLVAENYTVEITQYPNHPLQKAVSITIGSETTQFQLYHNSTKKLYCQRNSKVIGINDTNTSDMSNFYISFLGIDSETYRGQHAVLRKWALRPKEMTVDTDSQTLMVGPYFNYWDAEDPPHLPYKLEVENTSILNLLDDDPQEQVHMGDFKYNMSWNTTADWIQMHFPRSRGVGDRETLLSYANEACTANTTSLTGDSETVPVVGLSPTTERTSMVDFYAKNFDEDAVANMDGLLPHSFLSYWASANRDYRLLQRSEQACPAAISSSSRRRWSTLFRRRVSRRLSETENIASSAAAASSTIHPDCTASCPAGICDGPDDARKADCAACQKCHMATLTAESTEISRRLGGWSWKPWVGRRRFSDTRRRFTNMRRRYVSPPTPFVPTWPTPDPTPYPTNPEPVAPLITSAMLRGIDFPWGLRGDWADSVKGLIQTITETVTPTHVKLWGKPGSGAHVSVPVVRTPSWLFDMDVETECTITTSIPPVLQKKVRTSSSTTRGVFYGTVLYGELTTSMHLESGALTILGPDWAQVTPYIDGGISFEYNKGVCLHACAVRKCYSAGANFMARFSGNARAEGGEMTATLALATSVSAGVYSNCMCGGNYDPSWASVGGSLRSGRTSGECNIAGIGIGAEISGAMTFKVKRTKQVDVTFSTEGRAYVEIFGFRRSTSFHKSHTIREVMQLPDSFPSIRETYCVDYSGARVSCGRVVSRVTAQRAAAASATATAASATAAASAASSVASAEAAATLVASWTSLATQISAAGTTSTAFVLSPQFACDYPSVAMAGEILIDAGAQITVFGDGAVLDASRNGRFFKVMPGGSLTLNDLTLKNGRTSAGGSAVYCEGSLFVSGCIFVSNTVPYAGFEYHGSWLATALLDVANFRSGGGILFAQATSHASSGGPVGYVSNSSFQSNAAPGGGGAIGVLSWHTSGTGSPNITIAGSTYSLNSGGLGAVGDAGDDISLRGNTPRSSVVHISCSGARTNMPSQTTLPAGCCDSQCVVAANHAAGLTQLIGTPWEILSGSQVCAVTTDATTGEWCVQDQSGNYANNQDCRFRITNPLGRNLVVTRKEWALEYTGGTCWDYLQMTPGTGSSSFSLFCGGTAGSSAFPVSFPVAAATSRNFVFHSDGSVVDIGFKLCVSGF